MCDAGNAHGMTDGEGVNVCDDDPPEEARLYDADSLRRVTNIALACYLSRSSNSWSGIVAKLVAESDMAYGRISRPL